LYKIPATTLFIGQNLVFVPECHSTNDLALKLCQQYSSPEGTLVITQHQTRGRGQRGNTWDAAPGKNLTFSVVLKPTFLAVKDQFFLNIISSLAVLDYLKIKIPKEVKVKWPNDVMADNRKICGILIENQLQGSAFTNVVVGIGVNINQQQFAVNTATSLSLITGQQYDLQGELEVLLQALEVRYLQLREQKFSLLREAYTAAMFWLQENRTFSSGHETFDGRITGIDESGKLIVQASDSVRSFAIKEVSFVR
jgi:BirA family biotin operon repressor/biotin-[acetyl-CoA-carboxylase] ligase